MELPSAKSRPDPRSWRDFLVVLPLAGLTAGLLAWLADRPDWAAWIWAASTLPVLAALIVEIVSSLRRGDVGLDIVAALSMAGALLVGETLAAAVVALMYAGGRHLELFAERRARRSMTSLLQGIPRTATLHRDGSLEQVDLNAVRPGDCLLIRQGEVVPVDGTVARGTAVLDRSALTGESLPVRHLSGEAVMSGAVNAGDAFDLTASRKASESTYAGILRLVEAAQASKAPMARIADSYAIVFLAISVVMAGGAWLLTGDPVRAVAVLVIATPCPLILAVPVAIVSGLSRAARQGILVKGGAALERLARIRSLVIDKTGTLTFGQPTISEVHAAPGYSPAELLRLAASLDQASHHVMARAIVADARSRNLRLSTPGEMTETPGEGIEGTVEGQHVIVGGMSFVASRTGGAFLALPSLEPGTATVSVAIDRKPAGLLVLSDQLRDGTRELLTRLKGLGIERIVLATGDRQDVAESVSDGLPIDARRSDLTPDQKVAVVLSERKYGPVMMIGDGVNDAPALAAADVGVSMGARGAAAAAETADVVLLVDRLDRILPAMLIARRSRNIALESVYVGMGLSILGMGFAAFGYIAPMQGALIQEGIDVAVILNALRALGSRNGDTPGAPAS